MTLILLIYFFHFYIFLFSYHKKLYIFFVPIDLESNNEILYGSNIFNVWFNNITFLKKKVFLFKNTKKLIISNLSTYFKKFLGIHKASRSRGWTSQNYISWMKGTEFWTPGYNFISFEHHMFCTWILFYFSIHNTLDVQFMWGFKFFFCDYART